MLAKRMSPILQKMETEDRDTNFGPDDIKSERNATKLIEYLTATVAVLVGMFNHPSESNF